MITLASDFGSPYPAAMRGVVLDRTDARIVDIAHDFPRQDVRTAAFWLREVLPWFPPAVHCAVVDPGVGTDRAAIALRVGQHALVGPDNGLLLPAARRLRERSDRDSEIDAFEIRIEDPESSTFHGRDVFAPAAADIHAAGVEAMADLDGLDPIEEYETLQFPEPTVTEDVARGAVLVVDGFGNVITNLPGELLDGLDVVRIDDEQVPVEKSFAYVDHGERLATVGSHGNVELAVNQGRGDQAFDLDAGDEFTLSRAY